MGAAVAIKRGLEKGKGGYWIHTSGTDILLNPKVFAGEFQDGKDGREVKVYDDWDGVGELISFPGTVHLCYTFSSFPLPPFLSVTCPFN